MLYSGATLAPLRTWNGETAGDAFGASIALGPDVDGDGKGDVIIGARHYSPGGVGSAGRAYLFSGATGTQLCTWTGTAAAQLVGQYTALGPDANGDGKGDVFLGTGVSPATATLYSGATCALLWSLASTYVAISLGPDVDGDGRADALTGDQTNGIVTLWSGATGKSLGTFGSGLGWGNSVSVGPDMDNDGRGDLLVGWSTWGGNDEGQAQLFSGATKTMVQGWAGLPQLGFYGATVILGPDADGDGRADVLIHANSKVDLLPSTGGPSIRSWQGTWVAMSLGPDADGDGRGDVALVGSTGQVSLFGSATW
jgi:hypothetical protein